MVFSSAIFLFAFLPLVFLLSRLPFGLRYQNILLAAASLVFYAFGQLYYVPLFLLSVLINYLAGRLLAGPCKRSRAVVAVAVVLELGVLAVFKYTDFLIANWNALSGAAHPLTGIVLPIGISFFTFQGLSYVIDSYRDPETATRDFLDLLLYLSFFPQLIAGPIVKYHDIADQIRDRQTSPEGTAAGICRFILGLSKKILIADAVGAVADRLFANGALGDVRLAWLAGICYMLQIYYDFSGYSDMAIGMGHMFGFRLRENFLFPYGASDLRDFWRRWHVSLTGWFREYVYIPMGGNRKGPVRTALNRLLVFFCTGLWHGANWTFVVWGLAHGLLTSLEGLGLLPADRLKKHAAGRLLCRVWTLFAVMLLFIVFRADNLAAAGQIIALLFTGGMSAEGSLLLHRLLTPAAIFVLLLAILCAGNLPNRLRPGFRTPGMRVPILLLCLGLYALSVLSLAKGGFHPFLYFQF